MAWYQPKLHDALAMDRMEEARELIKDGADVNFRDRSGRTPLDYCTVVDHCYRHLTPEGETSKPLPISLGSLSSPGDG